MMTKTTSSRERFLRLLRDDILKLGLADLDFGIYRILNYRRGAIETFLSETLPAGIEAVLNEQAGQRQSALQREVAELRERLEATAQGVGLGSAFTGDVLKDPLKAFPVGQEYVQKAEALLRAEAEARFSDSEEERMYNALYTFFSRYYEDGDFLPQPRRGKEARFSVDYQGDDVHFSWRGRGSHYVKSGEQLRTYAFKIDGTDIRFQFVSADLAKDNTKGDKRYLVPLHDPEITESSITVSFEFRPLTGDEAKLYTKAAETQEKLIDDALKLLYPKLNEAVGRLERGVLGHHMRRYARKNLTDYFVHPNLGGFLKGEFDYYLKNEYLDVGSFTSPEALTDRFVKFRALQEVGYDIISFLDQIESFQARLFEKRRFVLQADYLVPARLLSDELKVQAAQNEAQVQAWRELFALSGEVSKETLDSHPTLVVDTRHFDAAFKRQVLALFDDLDEVTDGVLVHSENYGALRTLESKLQGKVSTIFIDPPYNTGLDEFLYKDDFSKHSTWMTMMEERLLSSKRMLTASASLWISLDDTESAYCRLLGESVFGANNFIADVAWEKVYSPRMDAQQFSNSYDHILTFATDENWSPNRTKIQPNLEQFPLSDEQGRRYRSDPLRKWGKNSLRSDRPSLWFPITSPDGTEVYPVKPDGTEGRWRWQRSTVEERYSELDWLDKGNGLQPYVRQYADNSNMRPLETIWKYEDAGSTHEAQELLKAILPKSGFTTPKPLKLIKLIQQASLKDENAVLLDFFAGSGTTGHSVISTNRGDGQRRQFVMVEMGEYFDTVLSPRIQKVLYCPTWRDGVPAETTEFPLSGVAPDWVERSPRLVKVLRLESYEDSLNALELPQEQSARARGLQDIFGQDYLLKYLLPTEVEDTSEVFLNTERLERPFDYKLRIHTPEGPKDQPVDLIETFNLLMGYHVKRMFQLTADRDYMCIEAQSDEGPVLVIWRDLAGLDPAVERAFLEGALEVAKYAKVYVNGDSALPGAESLDAEFKNRLLARAVGILA